MYRRCSYGEVSPSYSEGSRKNPAHRRRAVFAAQGAQDRARGDRQTTQSHRRTSAWVLGTLGAATVLAFLSAIFGAGANTSASASATPASAVPSGIYGTLPPVGSPTSGGTITVGQVTGSTPTFIMPILPAAQDTTSNAYRFINLLYPPLYSAPLGASPIFNQGLSLAYPPKYSHNGMTVSIDMKQNFHWSNGMPVDANDVLFEIDLLRAAVHESASNYCCFAPGLFPMNIAHASVPSKYKLVIDLTHRYNSTFYTYNQLGPNNLTPMPSTAWNVASQHGPHLNYAVPSNARKIYNYLAAQGADVSTFASDALWRDVDGPFRLVSFSPSTSSFVMAPNSHYGGTPRPRFSRLEVETFTSLTAQLNQIKLGNLDVASLDYSELGQAGQLRSDGYSVFGYPSFGFDDAVLNFKDHTDDFNHVVAQLYVRQAMASLIDQPGIIKGILKGAGGVSFGPVPPIPANPYTPANATKGPYPFSTATASRLLRTHGWRVVPNGTTTCVRPGSGAGQCGGGIPSGTPISFTWLYTTSSESYGLEAQYFASEAAQVGIHVSLTAKTENYLFANYDDADAADAKFDNSWGVSDFGGFINYDYPTTNTIFNTSGTFNYGAYNSGKADQLITASQYGNRANAVKAEASFLTANVPALFFPNPDYIFAVKSTVGGTANSWLAATQTTYLPQYWYFVRK